MLDKLIDFLIQFADLFKFWAVFGPNEAAVHIRLGKVLRVCGPGLFFRLPMNIDHFQWECTAIRTTNLGALATTTADGKQVGFEVVVTHKIHDIQTALMKVWDVEDAIKDACLGMIGQELTLSNWADLSKSETLDKLTKVCRNKGWKYGVEIISVQLAGVSLVKNIRILSTQHYPYNKSV
jgi:hypothetical protein